MNTSTSEYSGACESGWTMYLDQFSSSEDQCNRSMPVDVDSRRKGVCVNEDEEDEDSSMLSDASSGPPNFPQEEDYSEETRYNFNISATTEQKQGKHRKRVKEGRSNKQQNLHLDDTASSPVQSFSKNNADHAVPIKDKYLVEQSTGFSQGFSATHYKGKSVLKKHFGFLKSSHQPKS